RKPALGFTSDDSRCLQAHRQSPSPCLLQKHTRSQGLPFVPLTYPTRKSGASLHSSRSCRPCHLAPASSVCGTSRTSPPEIILKPTRFFSEATRVLVTAME